MVSFWKKKKKQQKNQENKEKKNLVGLNRTDASQGSQGKYTSVREDLEMSGKLCQFPKLSGKSGKIYVIGE